MKPRKQYRPRPVSLDPVADAIARATVLRPEQVASLAGPVERAWLDLRTGTQPDHAWRDLADAMNVAEQLADAGIASDRMPEILTAQEALADLAARHNSTGSWTLRSHELRRIEAALEFHGIQLDHCTQGEMADAIRAVKRKVAQAIAGNASKRASVHIVGGLGVAALSAPASPPSTRPSPRRSTRYTPPAPAQQQRAAAMAKQGWSCRCQSAPRCSTRATWPQ